MNRKYSEIEMFYGDYKEKYPDCKTKFGSYNKETKTVIVCVPENETQQEREAEIIKFRAKEHIDKIRFEREELGLSDEIIRKVEVNLFRTLGKLKAADIIRNKSVFTYDSILSVAKKAANK